MKSDMATGVMSKFRLFLCKIRETTGTENNAVGLYQQDTDPFYLA